MKTAKVIIYLLLAVLFTVSVVRSYSYDMFFVDVLVMITFKTISFGAIATIIYYFIKDVCCQPKKKSK